MFVVDVCLRFQLFLPRPVTSRCDKGTLRNIKNVVGNFVTCTDGCCGEFKNVTIMFQHGSEAGH